eukprot:TRINITY_DN11638_c0_g1_i2.p1 TRINITY_DN11638_c0_g1~~TRINITY_DN11638_c0_g1_i2.p1  ORF type:complete len:211 (-),score=41.97 TRINITY_DN11638_c0_g1_i2:192-824(-)
MSSEVFAGGTASAEELEATLLATLQVVEAQRRQLNDLQIQVATSQEEAASLEWQLEREREGRLAAEEKLRESSVDFARRLSTMQARVMEAERDVVLGGQVIVTARNSGTPCSAEAGSSAQSPSSQEVAWSDHLRVVPKPPPPRSGSEGLFSRLQGQILRAAGGPSSSSSSSSGNLPPSGSSSARRVRSDRGQRLEPLVPTPRGERTNELP